MTTYYGAAIQRRLKEMVTELRGMVPQLRPSIQSLGETAFAWLDYLEKRIETDARYEEAKAWGCSKPDSAPVVSQLESTGECPVIQQSLPPHFVIGDDFAVDANQVMLVLPCGDNFTRVFFRNGTSQGVAVASSRLAEALKNVR